MLKIPKCMSTQHPDNVNKPQFSATAEVGGEDEIEEAYHAFSEFGCDEQMWDFEGKEVDNFVVKKLLSKHEDFFKDHQIGKDLFITFRVPNPSVERAEAKILLETLESIPRSFDVAKLFYKNDVAPVFEVIVPMTTSAKCVDRVYSYYKDFVVGKQAKPVKAGDIKIADWIGEFKPEKINVIPLFEDMERMINADEIVKTYLLDKGVDYQRVFLARSDPAMNYGLISAVVLNKIALQRLWQLSADIGVKIFPIVGIGSAPFRGNLTPGNVEGVLKEYPSNHTFTIQSAFKYDFEKSSVKTATKKLSEKTSSKPQKVDEELCMKLVEKYSVEYQRQVSLLAPVINNVAKYVPQRRRRKLHIGLFGYSRNMSGITLPRAIPFTAAMYSIGFPPELLGLNALDDADITFLKNIYVSFDKDLTDALAYLNVDCPFIPKDILKTVASMELSFEINKEHKSITNNIIKSLKNGGDIGPELLKAAHIRGFLG